MNKCKTQQNNKKSKPEDNYELPVYFSIIIKKLLAFLLIMLYNNNAKFNKG